MASKGASLALLLTIVCCLMGVSSAWRVWLYRDSNHRGGHVELSGNGCKNVPSDFNDRTSSINTHGGCVRLYQNTGCTGRMLEAFPRSGAHNNLKAHGFNDRTSSVGGCPRRKRDALYNSFNN